MSKIFALHPGFSFRKNRKLRNRFLHPKAWFEGVYLCSLRPNSLFGHCFAHKWFKTSMYFSTANNNYDSKSIPARRRRFFPDLTVTNETSNILEAVYCWEVDKMIPVFEGEKNLKNNPGVESKKFFLPDTRKKNVFARLGSFLPLK